MKSDEISSVKSFNMIKYTFRTMSVHVVLDQMIGVDLADEKVSSCHQNYVVVFSHECSDFSGIIQWTCYFEE